MIVPNKNPLPGCLAAGLEIVFAPFSLLPSAPRTRSPARHLRGGDASMHNGRDRAR